MRLKENWQKFRTDDRLPCALGYRYEKSYTLLRKRNLFRLARQLRSYYRKLKRGARIPISMATGLLSRLGQLRHCNSVMLYKKTGKAEDPAGAEMRGAGIREKGEIEVEFIYGTTRRGGVLSENLKTVGVEHSDLSGYINTVKEFEDGTKITDRCRIVKKYASKEVNGVCYDWYLIDSHYRETDTSAKAKVAVDKVNANLDYLSMMAGIEIPQEEGANNGET